MKSNSNSLNPKSKADQKVYKKAKAIAYNYLSYRSRSKGEVLSKLVSKNIDKKFINKIIIDLEDEGLIDDISFSVFKSRLDSLVTKNTTPFFDAEDKLKFM